MQEAFCAVDSDKDGVIAAKDLENVLRFLGQNPSDAELQVSPERSGVWVRLKLESSKSW